MTQKQNLKNVNKEIENSNLKKSKKPAKRIDSEVNVQYQHNNIKRIREKRKRTLIALTASLIVCGILLAGAIAWGISTSVTSSMYAQTLENSYQRSFYDLVDNVNNAEMKLAKAIAVTTPAKKSEYLLAVSKNTSGAAENLSALPLSINGVDQTTRFINQLSGYCTSLCKTLNEDEDLTNEQQETIEEVYNSLVELQQSINKILDRLSEGISITSESLRLNGDYNNFTLILSNGSGDIEYPTMIYDGPFSTASQNPEIKGLTGDTITKEDCQSIIKKLFDDTQKIEFQSETKSKFETYDYLVTSVSNHKKYVQITKIGGKVLTISGENSTGEPSLTLFSAKNVASQFLLNNQIANMVCVWSDVIGDNAYLNFAPKENGIILYPDLIKLKVSMISGKVEGYEATSYYTNHTERNIDGASYDVALAQAKISSKLNVQTQRLVLAPLDYGREILCWEFVCDYNGSTYYVYINANNGDEENVLMVIETDNGNLLM